MNSECRGQKAKQCRRLAQVALVGLAMTVMADTPSWLAADVQAQTPGAQGRSRAENVQKLTGKKLRLDTSGRPRAISAQEARETVLQLEAVFAARAPQAPVRSGQMAMVELAGAANRTVVARPREDGSFVTHCVTTVDEAVDFLSGDAAAIVEDR